MYLLSDVAAVIEAAAPLGLAEPWDNCGLLCGSYHSPVENVTLALDATAETIRQAAALQSELLITHHPILFRPVQRLVRGQADADLVRLLFANELSLYAAHTNLDRAPAMGTAWALASALGLDVARPLPECAQAGENGAEASNTSLGLLAQLDEPLTVSQLAARICPALGTSGLQVGDDSERLISTVALVPGSGGDLLGAASEAGAELFLTGELKHHEWLLAASVGLTAMAAGHFATERPVVAVLARHLGQALPGLTVHVAVEAEPAMFLMPSDFGG